MLLTANLFPLMCFSIASVLNTVAISYHSLAAVPFGSIVVVLLIWILVSCPLCLFGTVCSQPMRINAGALCKVKHFSKDYREMNVAMCGTQLCPRPGPMLPHMWRC